MCQTWRRLVTETLDRDVTTVNAELSVTCCPPRYNHWTLGSGRPRPMHVTSRSSPVQPTSSLSPLDNSTDGKSARNTTDQSLNYAQLTLALLLSQFSAAVVRHTTNDFSVDAICAWWFNYSYIEWARKAQTLLRRLCEQSRELCRQLSWLVADFPRAL